MTGERNPLGSTEARRTNELLAVTAWYSRSGRETMARSLGIRREGFAMSGNFDRAVWQVTTDCEQVREWAEAHETVPVLAEEAGGTDLLMVSNPDDRGERLS